MHLITKIYTVVWTVVSKHKRTEPVRTLVLHKDTP